MKNFHEANARVTGKRKREVGLVVPAKFSAFTAELRIPRILERELNAKAVTLKLTMLLQKKINFHYWFKLEIPSCSLQFIIDSFFQVNAAS